MFDRKGTVATWIEVGGVSYAGDYAITVEGVMVSYKGNQLHGNELLTGSMPGGYDKVSLRMGSSIEWSSIHVLVATHFVDNPKGWKFISHKDGDRSNNRETNIEWTEYKVRTSTDAYDKWNMWS